jgi:hypothetical protein
MMFLLALEVEKVFRRFAGELCFFLELTKRRVGQMLATFEHATRQSPFGLSRDEQDSFAFSTDDGGAFLQDLNSAFYSGVDCWKSPAARSPASIEITDA